MAQINQIKNTTSFLIPANADTRESSHLKANPDTGFVNGYQKIIGTEYRNIFVVGDLHGCYSLLMSKLEEVAFDPSQDLLISVGDLIDRGQDSCECLALIEMPWFKAVRGNHEQMAIDAKNISGVRHWVGNGGAWFYQLDADKEILMRSLMVKVARLPLVLELVTGDKTIVIAHADYPDDSYEFGKSVCAEQVIWNRGRVNKSQEGRKSDIEGADLFVFGHTPVTSPVQFGNQLYIDSGAVFTGQLTLIQLQGEAI
ncbi:metallophosphoesterase [Buttiauxella selenatireducens]|uniref:Metallophosphoesterase n=1 Tax=Buttiauxella selenatireducens TaxID=3073902 RepID=A0ABY9SH64_9ENTR|nr:metallophosphoesterase [Buttiauxella sp. R73]WMY75397.1 metallophosphoesterase [Buttiauxella sp. R73]